MKKNIFSAIIPVLLAAVFMISCVSRYDSKKDIVVLYTNDVHCGIDENIGYAGLALYKANMLAQTPNVTLVDAGDAIQGAAIGTISKGKYIVEIMNQIGYDFAVFGNHEFDYGMENLSELVKEAKAQYLACNITYTGNGTDLLAKRKPYKIVDYDGIKVAYIGVATPESIVKSTPAYFMENGEMVYSFDAADELYKTVQKNVDEVRKAGAKYVILVAHLGIEEESEPNRSTDVIANTTGIDVVIDGHSHSTVGMDKIKNKNGLDVVYSQTGTKLKNIGKLTITPEGVITAELVDNVEKDTIFTTFVNNIKERYESLLNVVVAQSEVLLSTKREDGTRAVRNRETAIGDLCADAYRAVAGADIAFVNGGGIRADIPEGPINSQQIINVHPYGNMLCMVETTGQQILDALELGSSAVTSSPSNGSNALGELGGFLQVSGLRYTIDTNIPSTVEKDSTGFFTGVKGRRRVKNVQVLRKDGSYVNIDPKAKYTLACHNYLLQDRGDGYSMFVNDKYLLDKSMLDNQVLITYIRDHLGGVIPADRYKAPQGRITVI